MAKLTAVAVDAPPFDAAPTGPPADAPGRLARLAELRLAGVVRQASEPTGAVEQFLPVSAQLRPLLPGGALRRGGTVAVAVPRPTGVTGTRSAGTWSASARTGGARADGAGPARADGAAPGAMSLLLALVAEASAAGSWCAVVGLPGLGLVAAAEAGVAVERFALVPHPGPDWAAVVAALVDGVDIVVVATPGSVAAPVASRLTARARQRGAVLITVGQWPGVDLTVEVTGGTWHGLGQGRGRLRSRELEVFVHGRGAAARGRHGTLWLPGAAGDTAPAATPAPLGLVPELTRRDRTEPDLPGLAELDLAG
jgi:hypothetical protein